MNPSSILVSVIVITYNSEKYIIETLNSVKNQTYNNIELIISDDGSTDNTYILCKQWMENNSKRFNRSLLLYSKINTGVPGNCNRGVKAAFGDWVKFIAGDDLLLPNAIEDAVSFIINCPENIEIFDSKVKIYNETVNYQIGLFDFSKSNFYTKCNSANYQFKIYCNNIYKLRIISTVGVFIKRSLILELNGFNEKYKLLEDTPFFQKVLKYGVRFYYLDKETVIYRKHENALSVNKSKNGEVLTQFSIIAQKYIEDELYRYCTIINKIDIIWFKYMTNLVLKLGNKGFIASKIFRIAQIITPSKTFLKLSNIVNKILNKNLINN